MSSFQVFSFSFSGVLLLFELVAKVMIIYGNSGYLCAPNERVNTRKSWAYETT